MYMLPYFPNIYFPSANSKQLTLQLYLLYILIYLCNYSTPVYLNYFVQMFERNTIYELY